jgi:hypothetical protein
MGVGSQELGVREKELEIKKYPAVIAGIFL